MIAVQDPRLIDGNGRVALTYNSNQCLTELPPDECVVEGLVGVIRGDGYIEAILWNPYEALAGGAFVWHVVLPASAFRHAGENMRTLDLLHFYSAERAYNLSAEARSKGVLSIDRAKTRRKVEQIAVAIVEAANSPEVGKVFPVYID